jgi:hypothetical protein
MMIFEEGDTKIKITRQKEQDIVEKAQTKNARERRR